ncbi:Spectrin beta chain [Folsomia candida]|uniref:Spectrin beta chain n=1 Tax=Folsomia candida TaxID=158441 RepID=A0A226EUC7_FOLCA|nr:Spectrin beta chain [Folsomia candida]
MNIKRPGPSEDGVIEGSLIRKHEWESTTKKASNRSWSAVYTVLKGGSLLFYKDQKNFKTQPDAYFRGENPVDLSSGNVEVASDYTKKKNVFRLKLSSGGEYLFQARDDEEMNLWVRGIQEVSLEAAGAGPSRAQTLPASSMEKKDEPKKRGFFTLKKK